MEIKILQKDDSWEQMRDKLFEEVDEVTKEIEKDDKTVYGRILLLGELWDLIQVAIGMMYQVENEIPGSEAEGFINYSNQLHNMKLNERGWKYAKGYKIEEAEGEE